MSKILYNQIFEKIGTPYSGGSISIPVGSDGPCMPIINTKAWFFEELQNNLNQSAVVCMAMGDNGLHKIENEYYIGTWSTPIYKFKEFNSNIRQLWCTHASIDLLFIHGIPAGLMFSDNSNIDLLELAEEIDIERNKLLLVKYNSFTHHLRPRLSQYYTQFDWATVENHDNNFDIGYFTKMKEHKFVLCPRGNGPDSYRVWEALHMGSIPIVQSKNSHGCHHYFDLPILQLDSLFDLTEDFLEQKYQEMQKKYNWDQLIEEYWLEQINKSSYIYGEKIGLFIY